MFTRTVSFVAALVLVGAVSSQVLAARFTGPLEYRGVVPANSSVMFHQAMGAGDSTKILLQGAGNANLDLYVVNPQGQVIARDTRPGDRVEMRFVAPTAGHYRFILRNTGSVADAFVLTFF